MTSTEATGARARVGGVLASWERWLPWLLLAIALTYPFWYDVWPFTILTLDALGLELDVVIFMVVYVMLALGLNVVVGFAGLLDLGYVAFFALGAYSVGWFASDKFSGTEFHLLSNAAEGAAGIHLNLWLVLLLGGVITAIAGVIIGWPTLRLRGDYLAIVTLGFGEIIPDVFRNADKLPVPGGVQAGPPFIDFTNVNLTNGVRGVRSLDRPGFGDKLDSLTAGALPERFSGIELKPWYFTIVFMVLIAVFVIRRLERSKMGRAWVAVREDEIAASAMGVPLMRTKLWAYGIGAIFGGIVGAYYGSFIGSVFPTSFSFAISILVLVMVVVGGMGNIYGVMLGALVLEYLNFKGLQKIGDGINNAIDLVGIDQTVDIPRYKTLIFGLLLVTMMLLRPEGMIPSARRKAELHEEEDLIEPDVYDDLYDVRREGA
ncbi:MAG: branched-chain amino acid ABC transporter permease [Thermoleophilia bacterium]|nr:branched-chain amino acid ABC transporter permease [Thermoleophilia bacterium]MDH4339650.1 branched-chain amino acid ABC transporter permease [Thermoleophilia bacterium]MDH5280662.1 branched-chain amino acid ABC transporter permease [Thermoleophilia bacterium]